MKNFSIIVAVDEKMGIGKAGGLPWKLSRDMQRFKEVTLPCAKAGCQNAVVMGRKTWESLPRKYRPLPGRLNVVISSQAVLALPEGVLLADSFDKSLELLDARKDVGDVFIIGGGVVFNEAIMHKGCTGLYLTHIEGNFGCDILFPVIPDWFKIGREFERLQEGDIGFRFCDYSKI